VPDATRGEGAGSGSRSSASSLGALPNMRLKLAGLSLLKESECCALAGTNYRSTSSALAGTPPAA